MSKFIGGPKPCGCPGLYHRDWCQLATNEQKERHQRRVAQQMERLLGKKEASHDQQQ